MQRILLIGSGAREHAIAKAIHQSQHPYQLLVLGPHLNPGIQALAHTYQCMSMTDIHPIGELAQHHHIDWAIIGPEAPLEAGVADHLTALQIPCIGPKTKLAQIETSKGFARDLLSRYEIPGCPEYRRFTEFNSDLMRFLTDLGSDYVIKADGLMGGKGVKVSGDHLQNHVEAKQFCQELFAQNISVVIEQKCVGEEFSLFSFSDGVHCQHMPLVQDHKRAFVGDLGPNTGGMGSYTYPDHRLPFLTEKEILDAQKINEATIAALREEFAEPYVGILYGGFMATPQGVRVIEFNARFGDPEALNLLSLLESDFLEICHAMLNGILDQQSIRFKHLASVCKYFVPEGYPDRPLKQKKLSIANLPDDLQCFYASVSQQENDLNLLGSRAVALVALADSVNIASDYIEVHQDKIKGPVFHRADIGSAELMQKKITRMQDLRK